MTRPTLTTLPDAEAAAAHTARLMAATIDDAAGEVHIALAGGGTPRRAYELLAERDGPWRHVHLWLGDERCIAGDHPDANERLVRESLVDRLGGEQPHLHGARGELGPEDAAWLYGRALGDEPVLDLVLLGLGEDAHTASLFPGHPALAASTAPVVPVRGAPKPPPERITLTLPVLRRARRTVLLTTGETKREALERVLARDPSAPAALLGDGLDEIVCDAAASPTA